jgi:acyl-coenzyme A synthetase/AMP-(fatty) acid ligase
LEFASPVQLASLKTVIVAGEACSANLVRRHYALPNRANLYNEYGPTEGTVWCSVYRVPPVLPGHTVPIGRPIENMQLYVLDRHLEPLPVGVPGELYLAGTGVVSGYLNRSDLTSERFVKHTWPEVGPVRLYRTGDLARWLAEGNLEFLGRSDQQVKIRGFRIELEEIEALLGQQPEVKQAIVAARPADRRDENMEDTSAGLTAGLLRLDAQTAARLLEEVEAVTAEQAAWLLVSTGSLYQPQMLEDRDDA